MIEKIFQWLKPRMNGVTYYEPGRRFSINEGEIPTIYISWSNQKGFYVCLSEKVILTKFWY